MCVSRCRSVPFVGKVVCAYECVWCVFVCLCARMLARLCMRMSVYAYVCVRLLYVFLWYADTCRCVLCVSVSLCVFCVCMSLDVCVWACESCTAGNVCVCVRAFLDVVCARTRGVQVSMYVCVCVYVHRVECR